MQNPGWKYQRPCQASRLRTRARSAMGQSTHLFTTAGLARYVSTIANSGTCYDLTLVKYITDSSGSVLKENKATVHNTLDLPQELWDTIHAGMRGVVQNHSAFSAQAAPAFNGQHRTGPLPERQVLLSRAKISQTTVCLSVMRHMTIRKSHLLSVSQTATVPQTPHLLRVMSFPIIINFRMNRS